MWKHGGRPQTHLEANVVRIDEYKPESWSSYGKFSCSVWSKQVREEKLFYFKVWGTRLSSQDNANEENSIAAEILYHFYGNTQAFPPSSEQAKPPIHFTEKTNL